MKVESRPGPKPAHAAAAMIAAKPGRNGVKGRDRYPSIQTFTSQASTLTAAANEYRAQMAPYARLGANLEGCCKVIGLSD